MRLTSKIAKIVAIPNTGISLKEDSLYLAKSDVDFFNELGHFYEFSIAGIVVETNNAFHSMPINCPYHNLSVIKSQGKKSKLRIYVETFINAISLIRKQTLFYLYFPSSPLLVILPLLIISRSPYALYLRADWQRRGKILTTINKFFFKHAQFILCTGPQLVKQLNNLNIKAEMVVPMTGLLNNNAAEKSDYSIKNTSNLLFVGRLTFEKGILELLDALNSLNKQGVDFNMHFVGPLDEAIKNQFEEKIGQYGLHDHIIMHGQVTDPAQLARHYAQSDLFVFPSHHEGFPRVIYEAMAHALPIVTTQLPYLEALLEKGDEICTIPINNANKLSESIFQALNDEPLRKYLGTSSNHIFKVLMSKLKYTSHAQQVHSKIQYLHAS